MASVKVKMRPSIVENKEGTVYYQLIHNRVTRQINTDYKIFPGELNKRSANIILPLFDESRKNYLLSIKEKIIWDTERLANIIEVFSKRGVSYTADEVVSSFEKQIQGTSFFVFMQQLIVRFKQFGRIRTSETYKTTLNSFMHFRNGKDLYPYDINSELMTEYEAYLRSSGVSQNSSSFYMRILRAAYNRSVEKGLAEQNIHSNMYIPALKKRLKEQFLLKLLSKSEI